jgi:hypothetical protein
MNWFQLAFGLIKEAVTTEQGREVINNVRSAVRGEGQPAPPSASDIHALLVEQRAQIDRNIEAIVQSLNAQNQRFNDTIRRLRIWNAALTVGLVIALLLALLAYF